MAGALGLASGAALLLAPADSAETRAAQAVRPPGAREAKYTRDGVEGCMECHGAKSMALVAETAHGDRDNPDTPYAQKGCESCHGPGSVHSSRAGGGRGFPPLITFLSEEEQEALELEEGEEPFHESHAVQVQACMECHGKDMGDLPAMAWKGSVHDVEETGCIDCHDSHSLENPLGERQSQTEICASCHEEVIETHPRFESKGILYDELSCYTCHDVHQLLASP